MHILATNRNALDAIPAMLRTPDFKKLKIQPLETKDKT